MVWPRQCCARAAGSAGRCTRVGTVALWRTYSRAIWCARYFWLAPERASRRSCCATATSWFSAVIFFRYSVHTARRLSVSCALPSTEDSGEAGGVPPAVVPLCESGTSQMISASSGNICSRPASPRVLCNTAGTAGQGRPSQAAGHRAHHPPRQICPAPESCISPRAGTPVPGSGCPPSTPTAARPERAGSAVAQTVWAGRRARGRAWPHLVQPFQVYGQLRADGGQVGCSVGPLAQRVGEVHAD